MHDIRLIRENPAAFDAALSRRGVDALSSEILAIDAARRAKITEAEAALADRNAASKLVGKAKASGDEAEFERLRALVADKKDQIARLEDEAKAEDERLTELLMGIPNLPMDDVPDGGDEDDNVEVKRWGNPANFAFDPKEHYEIGEAMGLMDFETAAKLSGSRFMLLSGALIRLHRALAQFMLDTHVDVNGLTETWTPVLVRNEMMLGTGQLPKFGDDSFFAASMGGRARQSRAALAEFCTESDLSAIRSAQSADQLSDALEEIYERAPTDESWWLIPTAEVTLTNIVAGHIVDESYLPRRYTAHTQCFRSEAGSAGRDTAGMLRQHQFEKVEMVSVTKPEDSLDELERMRGCAEGILEALELPYRTVILCTGDMGFGSRKTYDLEVWLPGQNTYREISSCSVCGDFQARRMNGRFRREGEKKPEFVHTLNGSGLAVGRALIAVMENYQEADGSVRIPAVLQPYMKGATVISADGVPA
ncbi:MAG: serine--tRNA ligase [Pseudomonadota bacterium]